MTESKAYNSVSSCPFIKFVEWPETPKEYYLKKIKYYIAKIETNPQAQDNGEKAINKIYSELITSIEDHIKSLNRENNTRIKLGDPETMYLLAYIACNRAWVEAACTDQSYANTIPARRNNNQAVNLGYFYVDSNGDYAPQDVNAPTFFNKMDSYILDILSDDAKQILLSSSYYGKHPVIDIDAFNSSIHKSIYNYHKAAEQAGHKIKNSRTPNKKFHETIQKTIVNFDTSLTEVTSSLDFTKQNPLSY